MLIGINCNMSPVHLLSHIASICAMLNFVMHLMLNQVPEPAVTADPSTHTPETDVRSYWFKYWKR